MTGLGVALDPRALRAAFAELPSGVVAVCAVVGGRKVGLAASSFVPVSLDPPLAAFCVQNSSATWPVLRAARRLGVSVLAAGHSGAVYTLAAKSGDRFAGLATAEAASGALFVDGAPARFEVEVVSEVPAGDHTLVLLRLVDLATRPGTEAVVFHRSELRRVG